MTLRDDIITSCRVRGRVTISDIARDTGCNYDRIRWTLIEMCRLGILDQTFRRLTPVYYLTEDPTGLD